MAAAKMPIDFACCNNISFPVCNKYVDNVIDAQKYVFDSKGRNLNLMYLNARSIKKEGRVDHIQALLNSLNKVISVVAVAETWLKPQEEYTVNIPGYNSVFCSRSNKRGGGVAIFVNNNLNFRVVYKDDETVNMLTIEIISPHHVSDYVSVVYNPPNYDKTSFNLFMDKLDTLFHNYRGKRHHILGDININLLDDTNQSALYLNTCHSNAMHVLNSFPTRHDAHVSSLIDHYISNLTVKINICTVSNDDSDHDILLVSVSKSLDQPPNNQTKVLKSVVDYRQLNANLKHNLEHSHIYEIPDHDTNMKYDDFIECFRNAVDQATTVKECIPNLVNVCPWMTGELQFKITQKNKLYKKFKSKPHNYMLRTQLKTLQNEITALRRRAKKNYFSNLLLEANGNSKRTWQVLNEIMYNKSKVCSKTNILINDNNETIDNPLLVANMFNDYFVNAGPQLAHNVVNLPNDNIYLLNTLDEPANLSIFLRPTDVDEIMQIIKNKIKVNKSCGYDEITAKAVIYCADTIVPYIVNIINSSFLSGTFPEKLKTARVTPIYKSGDKNDVSNYRPISITPIISKLLEHAMKTRTENFLTTKHFFYEGQYGFRNKSNTATAVIDLVTLIQDKIDKGCITSGVFLDFSKAFDTVDHKILLQKLQHFGIRGNALSWYQSFLANRKQFIEIDNNKSETKLINIGVPQGSILGPLLFLIYINDMANLNLEGHLMLYADDTAIFYSDKNINTIFNKMQSDLVLINEYIRLNKLTVNAKKSNYMIMSSRQKNTRHSNELKINGDSLNQVTVVKYLGLYIDQHLSWSNHIQCLTKKISPVIGILYKISYIIPSHIKRIIYYSLIHSHLQYLSIVWGNAYHVHLEYLKRLQNKAIKNIYNLPRLTPTITLYKNANIMNIATLTTYETCLMVQNYVNNNVLTRNVPQLPQHNQGTRNKLKLFLHTPNTNYGKNMIVFKGYQTYNKLPSDITSINVKYNMRLFKSKLRKWLCQVS